jgi:two-component system chemotaxis response regulator CheB
VFRSLELGAVDYIQKPTFSELAEAAPLIREKVKAASFAKIIRNVRSVSQRSFSGEMDLRTVIAIGSSTGGTEALRNVLCALPERVPPIVIAQHIPAVYSRAFADRMNTLCPFEVKEAEDGDEVKSCRVLVAPGGKQMKVAQSARGLIVRVTDDAPVNRHKPSVDYLFHSVANIIGSKAIGVILTGMGSDGAKGLLEMKRKGAKTFAQDEESSVVYGMPRIAFEIGAVDKVASLSEIPKLVVKLLEKK